MNLRPDELVYAMADGAERRAVVLSITGDGRYAVVCRPQPPAVSGCLFPGARADVLTVWASVREAAGAARAALPQDVIAQAVKNLDEAAETSAASTAEEGASIARESGLDASPVTERADPSTWGAIVRFAHQHDPAAVVVGSRGRSAVRSAVLGSVSNGVVHHCRRPVVVVHPFDEGDTHS